MRKLASRLRQPAPGPAITLALIALLAGGPAAAQTDDAKLEDKIERFKDWRVRCAQLPASDNQRRCFMGQVVNVTQEGDDKSIPVLSIVVMRSDDKKTARMVLTLPLGVRLPPGVAVKVDEGKEARAPFQLCARDGCRSVLDMDGSLIGAMRKGKQARVAFADAQGKTGVIPVSLSGFTAAYNRLARIKP